MRSLLTAVSYRTGLSFEGFTGPASPRSKKVEALGATKSLIGSMFLYFLELQSVAQSKKHQAYVTDGRVNI